MLEVKIFTLYPDLFPGPLDIGIFKKAKENKIWNLKVINIRDYSKDNHGTVDDTPFGGGSGMLLRPDILASALDNNIKKGEKIIYLSPRGKKFDQNVARSLSKEKNVNFICGHFEGVDQRLLETRNIEEYSLGDFVLSGGEPASFVFVDALVRLLPGVLGNKDSIKEESFLLKEDLFFQETLHLEMSSPVSCLNILSLDKPEAIISPLCCLFK